jgi:ABC-type oligopeptide transport system substrate-binding subunit
LRIHEVFTAGLHEQWSQARRLWLYSQAEQILVEEAPILPLMYERLDLLLKPWVRRYHLSPLKQRFWYQVWQK